MTEEILSVGIDIGTSTTQLIFSKIFIENRGNAFSVPQIKIIGKEVVYRSQIYITPLESYCITMLTIMNMVYLLIQ